MDIMKFIRKNLFALVASVLTLVAVCLLFGPCGSAKGSFTGGNWGDLSGFQLIFGYSEKNTQLVGFGFGGFLALLLLVAGAVLAYFDKVPFGNYISAGLLLVGAILVFVLPQMASIDKDLAKVVTLQGLACTYVSGVLAILASGAMIAKPFVKLK